jgi:aspartyl-tRNA(Asn)/glutamyl-tRNA(Gln) amidotransferase subunit A
MYTAAANGVQRILRGVDLHTLAIADLAPLLRDRQLSPVELTSALLDRIEQLEPRVNAFILVLRDQALAAARDAEHEIGQGTYRGALHGVPIGLKDLFDVAGLPTTMGSSILRDNVATEDATVTRRLREAGAVIIGKQNLHEFAFGTTSENPHFGPVHNPWQLDHVPGGSSGGTAAAIAAGLTPAGLGSDTGGSIRIPASFCGTVGIKPTYGLVSRAGALPLSWALDHVGPLGRTVLDCAFVLQAIAGPDPADPSTASAVVRDYTQDLESGVAGLKIGVPREHFFDVVDPAVDGLVRDAIEELRGQGAFVDEVSLPHAVHAQPAGNAIMSVDGAAWHGSWLQDRADDYGRDVLNRLRGGLPVRAVEYLRAHELRTLLDQDFLKAFEQVDVIVAPSTPTTAPAIGKTFDARPPLNLVPRAITNRCTVPANLAGLPAVSVPCGFVDGLPAGLQIIGPAFGEALVLRVARAYERSTRWHTLPQM